MTEAAVADRIEKLTGIAHRLGQRLILDDLLRVVTDGAAELTGAPRTSCRLLNPSRTKLLAACRAGAPLHQDPAIAFTVGEGLLGWVAQQLLPLRTGAAESDPRFLPRPDMKETMGSFVGIPLVAGSTCIGVLSAVHPEADYFDGEDERLLLLLATMAAPHIDSARHTHLSASDGLTGARSRRALDQVLLEGDDADDNPLSVALVDVDHFGMVNERFGHAAGDEVLRGVAKRLSADLRPDDVLVRYGGEEFVLVLPATSLVQCAERAEAVCKAMARSPVSGAPVTVTVTISVGIAERSADESRSELLERAQGAVEEAKAAGGNCVVRA